MHVDVQVTVENLIEALFGGHLDYVVILRQSVDDPDQSGALSKQADGVFILVLPPRHSEVGLPVRARFRRGHVKEAALGTTELFRASLGVDERLGLLSGR